MNIVSSNLDENTILWRYMDLSKFLSLLVTESLWLARSDTFKDKKEGIFHDAMREELKKIYDNLDEKDESIDHAEIRNVNDFQNYLRDKTYLSCWHENSNENIVMWALYGESENSIAIKTTAKKLVDSLDIEVTKVVIPLVLDRVKYVEHSSEASEKSYKQPFFIKRPQYSYESEVRLYMRAKDRKIGGNTLKGYNLSLKLNTLIDEIYVHPDSEEWFYPAVKDLVKKYKLKASVQMGKYGNK